MELILIVMLILLLVLTGVSCWLAHRWEQMFYSAHEREKAAEKERDDLRAAMTSVLGLEGDDEQD